MNWNVPPGAMFPLLMPDPLTVWVVLSSFFHVTVVCAATVRVAGLNEKFFILIDAPVVLDGVVLDGVVLDGVVLGIVGVVVALPPHPARTASAAMSTKAVTKISFRFISYPFLH